MWENVELTWTDVEQHGKAWNQRGLTWNNVEQRGIIRTNVGKRGINVD